MDTPVTVAPAGTPVIFKVAVPVEPPALALTLIAPDAADTEYGTAAPEAVNVAAGLLGHR